ncbi:MAG: hypothetical protein IPK17_38480 [Chloroflexi bacterium]|uniref:hypothetical protein n=1 Tax=Candidatus Flexifilum breve TaxID=3140694 RepID=UPI0031363B5F|nr:hypothetical protein [Chloroflexota bacterium]
MQERYYSALEQMTAEQAREEMAAQRRRLIALRDQQTELTGALDAANANVQAGLGVFGGIFNALGMTPVNQLQEQLDSVNQQLDESSGLYFRLRQGLEEGAFAANDAREAERLLAEERTRLGNITTSAVISADRMTAEERTSRLTQIEREIELLGVFGGTSEETQTQIADLNAEADGLRMVFNSLADTTAEAAARTEALAGQTDAHFDALTREVEAREAVTKATNEYNESVAEAQAKRQELEDKTEDRRTEIVDAAAEKRTDIEERGTRDREKLLRDFTRTYTTSVGERDALAARRAQESAADRLQDQRENEDEALRSSREARDKQIRSLDKAYAEQQARLEQGLQREAGTRVAAINRAQVDAVNAANAQANIAAYGANGLRTIQNNYWRDVNSIAVQWANNTVNSLRGIMGSVAAQQANKGLMANSPAAYDFYGMSSFSSPTPLPAPITGYGTQGATGGMVYAPTINANGLNAAQAEAVAYGAFRSALHDAGYGQMGGR